MEIRSKLSGISFHVQNEVAHELIASGLCEQVVEEKKRTTIADFLLGRKPATRWGAGYVSNNGIEETLCIVAKCDCCKQSQTWTGTAILETSGENRNKFHHCGVNEVIPADILKKYSKLLPRKPEQAPADPGGNPMLRLMSQPRRKDDSDTEYVTGDPQPI